MKQVFINLSPIKDAVITIFEQGKSSSTQTVKNPEVFNSLKSITNIDEITLIGNKNYVAKYAKEYQTKFSNTKIKIMEK